MASQLDLLKERIPYDANIFLSDENYLKVLNRLLEDSKYIALADKYPFEDFSSYDLPAKYNNWQLRCCEELYQAIGKANIVSYAENGLSWTRSKDAISTSLNDEIMPRVGLVIASDTQ